MNELDVDRLLAFIHLTEDDKHPLAPRVAAMDGAIAIGSEREQFSSRELFFTLNTGKPAIWPFSSKTVVTIGEEHEWPDGSLQFQYLHSLSTADARKMGATKFSPFMAADKVIIAKPDGTSFGASAPWALLGGAWRPCADRLEYPEKTRVELGLGFALTARYEWTVAFGYNTGPRITFFTDPVGAREAFRLRDIPNGRSRRAALRNWVSGHWRRKTDDEEAKSWVKKHLRGAENFAWNSLRCRIAPPPFEVEQLSTPPATPPHTACERPPSRSARR